MLTREEFDRHIEGFHPEWVRSLRGELDAIARAGLEAEGDALTKIRNRVEGLHKLLAAPIPHARTALRRLQAATRVRHSSSLE